MLEKTMKQILIKKVNKWLDTIDDEEVVEAIKKDLIITGGCFTSMIQNEKPKDYDCYFKTKKTVMLVAQYYIDKWNEDHGKKRTGRGDMAKVMLLDCDNPSKEILAFYGVTKAEDSPAVLLSNLQKGRIKVVFPSNGVVGDPEEVRAEEELGTEDILKDIEEIDEFKADEIIEKEKKSFFPVFMSSNAITLSDGIQIIVRFYGDPSQIHDTFDFVHTKAYWTYTNSYIDIPREVYEAVVNKTLKYTGSKYPVCSLFRLRKFINRGWSINAGQILKMCMQVSDLDLQDINVLEDQLIGVDSLYFMALIEQFRKQQAKGDFALTTDYVTSIIDKIF